MKHMNPKLVKLLHEGFSMSTLEKMSDEQLKLLYKKVVKEQSTVPSNEKKTITATQTTVPPGGNATAPAGSKIENKGGKTIITTTTETELGEEEKEIKEKSVSKQQQKIMGLALSVKRGDTKKSGVSKKVQDMAKKMSEKDLEDFAGTKHKGLPKKKKETKEEVKKLEENIMKLIESHLPPLTTKGELLKTIKNYKG